MGDKERSAGRPRTLSPSSAHASSPLFNNRRHLFQEAAHAQLGKTKDTERERERVKRVERITERERKRDKEKERESC